MVAAPDEPLYVVSFVVRQEAVPCDGILPIDMMQNLNMIQKDYALPDNLRFRHFAPLKWWKALKENFRQHTGTNSSSFFRILVLGSPQLTPGLSLNATLERLGFQSRDDGVRKVLKAEMWALPSGKARVNLTKLGRDAGARNSAQQPGCPTFASMCFTSSKASDLRASDQPPMTI